MKKNCGHRKAGGINIGSVFLIVFVAMVVLAITAAVCSEGDVEKQADNQMSNNGEISGICGHGVTYEIDREKGELRIMKNEPGDGRMYHYGFNFPVHTPFDDYVDVIRKIVIEDGVKTIGNHAFKKLWNVETVTVFGDLETIGKDAFDGCKRMVSIDFQKKVGNIEMFAFGDCVSLRSIRLPSGTHVETNAFSNCTGLTEITIECDGTPGKYGGKTVISGSAFPCQTFYGYDDEEIDPSNEAFYGYTYKGDKGKMKIANCCGDGVAFSFDKTTKEMKIYKTGYGEGRIYHDYRTSPPWEFKDDIKSIVVEEGVKIVGRNSFFKLTALERVTLPDTASSIEMYAFEGCESLETIVMPKNFSGNIERGTFAGCKSLKFIELHDAQYICDDAFRGCESLESLNLPDNLKSIGICAFSGCKSLKSISIPYGIIDVDYHTFEGCTSLKSVKLPNGLKLIGTSAFEDCKSLEAIEIPGTVASLKSNAFKGCTSLCYINVKFGVGKIAADAFPDHVFMMHDFTSVAPNYENFPWHEYRGKSAGYMIAQNESGWCGNRTAFYFSYPTGEMRIDSRGGVREMFDFEKDKCPWEYVKDLIKSVKIVDIKNVGDYAFTGCKSLASVEILCDDAVSIGKHSFDGCKFLRQIKMPDSIETIGEYAFKGCIFLKPVKLPNNLKLIGVRAFDSCGSIEAIEIPDGCIVDSNAFIGCRALTKISIGEAKIASDAFPGHKFYKHDGKEIKQSDPHFSWREFKGYSISKMVEYSRCGYCGNGVAYKFVFSVNELSIFSHGNGTGRMDEYKDLKAHPWKDVESLIKSVRVAGIKSIGESAFAECSSIKEIFIGKDVEQIGRHAFAGCSSLTSITLPDGIKIGEFAFLRCSSLPAITIPENATIDQFTFYSCTKLTDVTFMKGIKNIPYGIFIGCGSLKHVDVPSTVKSIENYAFQNCKALSKINIPNGVESIGRNAFEGCISLKSIDIPGTVTSLKSDAFKGCVSLLKVTVYNGAIGIAEDSFPDHRFHLPNGTLITPGDMRFPGYIYTGPDTNAMDAEKITKFQCSNGINGAHSIAGISAICAVPSVRV